MKTFSQAHYLPILLQSDQSALSLEKSGSEGVQVLQQGGGRVPFWQQVLLSARRQGGQVSTLYLTP